LGHTASSSAGNPSFDTGTIAKGATSKPVFFNATGTWTYRCNVHPNTMNGATVVVT
jgi:plastocyanin